ncbi:ATP-binding protein [Streptomyces luteolus]|uniref:ATP-binding protein n=1 Tax=Streptomyces luteolus TaxID=3043615 RepID=A0ABT6T8M3_9ACTN|nr:ATP-binding protein [Streptomyces sp. B-S-A12]MDI3424226.1 ATP-binding protein [Streptomyces sp. B-S-A12]
MLRTATFAGACISPHTDEPSTVAPPAPDELAYSLTLPASLTSPAIARAAARSMLRAHGLDEAADTALQAVGELTACACRFSAGAEIYVSLRHGGDTIRVTVYDGHPRHTNARLAAACDGRRRSALRLLACVVRACGGEWGFGESREPGGGTRMWAHLPLPSACTGHQPPQGQ